jgi:hypothetical protein
MPARIDHCGRPKAAVNAPQSKRFAKQEAPRQSRERMECGGFSAALAPVFFGQSQTVHECVVLSAC